MCIKEYICDDITWIRMDVQVCGLAYGCTRNVMIIPWKNLQSFLSLANELPDFVSIMQPSMSNAKTFIFPSTVPVVILEVGVGASFTIKASFLIMCQVLGSRRADSFARFVDEEDSSIPSLFMIHLLTDEDRSQSCVWECRYTGLSLLLLAAAAVECCGTLPIILLVYL